MLVARVLLVLLASTLTSCSYPLSVAAHTTLQCLLCICILAAGHDLGVDNVLSAELADCLRDRRDDVAAELLGFADVFSLQTEFVLL